jgi:hypothetical protein
MKPLKPRRPDKRATRHPAMGFSYGLGGGVPFTRRSGVSLTSYAVNGIREAAALPLSIPAAPRGNRCCALRSPPACLTAAGSTRHPVSVRLCPPSMASRPCHSRFGSPISAGTQHPRCHIRDKSKVGIADRLPDGASAYPAYAVSAGSVFVGRIRRSRHPAIGAAVIMPDGA